MFKYQENKRGLVAKENKCESEESRNLQKKFKKRKRMSQKKKLRRA